MSSFNFLLGANVFIFLQNFPFNFLILYTLSRIIKFSASVDTRRQMATESGQFIHHSWQSPSIHHSWRRPRGRASTAGFCRRGRWVWAAQCRPSSPPGWCQTSETQLYVSIAQIFSTIKGYFPWTNWWQYDTSCDTSFVRLIASIMLSVANAGVNQDLYHYSQSFCEVIFPSYLPVRKK